MRKLFGYTAAVLFTAAFAATGLAAQAGQSMAAAPSANVKTMAGILAKLNHFATADEKKTLQGMVDSPTATANEKTLAKALMDVQHTVPADDKAKLETLMKDQKASEAERNMAGVLTRLNHTPSDTEKADLKKVAAM